MTTDTQFLELLPGLYKEPIQVKGSKSLSFRVSSPLSRLCHYISFNKMRKPRHTGDEQLFPGEQQAWGGSSRSHAFKSLHCKFSLWSCEFRESRKMRTDKELRRINREAGGRKWVWWHREGEAGPPVLPGSLFSPGLGMQILSKNLHFSLSQKWQVLQNQSAFSWQVRRLTFPAWPQTHISPPAHLPFNLQVSGDCFTLRTLHWPLCGWDYAVCW